MRIWRLAATVGLFAALALGLAQTAGSGGRASSNPAKPEVSANRSEQGSQGGSALAEWSAIAQILATLGVLIGVLAYFRQRKSEYEQGVITRYRECTSQMQGYFSDCEGFDHRDHVFDIAGVIPTEYSEKEYRRAIRFQILITHLEESHLLYEHPENHMQLMSNQVWTKTLFLWMRNGDLQLAAEINRGYLSPAFSRSMDLYTAIHRAYADGRLESPFPNVKSPLGSYTCDPRHPHYANQQPHLAVLAKIAGEYTKPMNFPRWRLPDFRRSSRSALHFRDGSHLLRRENPVHFAILRWLLLGDDEPLNSLDHAAFWKEAAEALEEYLGKGLNSPIKQDELYALAGK